MTREIVQLRLQEMRAPQVAVSNLAGVSTYTLSLWLRGIAELSEEQSNRIAFAVTAMEEVADESPVPVDWRRFAQLRPILEAKILGYKRARVGELRAKFAQENC